MLYCKAHTQSTTCEYEESGSVKKKFQAKIHPPKCSSWNQPLACSTPPVIPLVHMCICRKTASHVCIHTNSPHRCAHARSFSPLNFPCIHSVQYCSTLFVSLVHSSASAVSQTECPGHSQSELQGKQQKQSSKTSKRGQWCSVVCAKRECTALLASKQPQHIYVDLLTLRKLKGNTLWYTCAVYLWFTFNEHKYYVTGSDLREQPTLRKTVLQRHPGSCLLPTNIRGQEASKALEKNHYG